MPPKRTKDHDLPRGMVRRTGGAVTRKFSLYLPPDLAKRFQVRCVETDRGLSDVITELIAAWLDAPPLKAKPPRGGR